MNALQGPGLVQEPRCSGAQEPGQAGAAGFVPALVAKVGERKDGVGSDGWWFGLTLAQQGVREQSAVDLYPQRTRHPIWRSFPS